MTGAMPDRVARRATKGFLALSAGRAIAIAGQFVAFTITASELGPAELGVYSFAVAFIALFRFVTNFGFRGIVARDVAQNPEREGELVANLVWLRLGLGLLAWVLVVAVAQLGGFEGDQREAAIIAGALLVFLALDSFEISLEVQLRTGWIAMAEMTKSALLVAGSIVLAAQGAGPSAFLGLYVLTNVVRLIFPTLAAAVGRAYEWRPKASVWLSIGRAAAFLGLAQLCIALYYRLDILLLARFKPAADVGQYGVAYQFLETFVVLPTLAMVVLTPIIARSVVEGGEILQRRLTHLLHLTTLVALPIAVAGAMTAFRLVPAIPGYDEYEGAGEALSILAPSAVAIFFGTVLSGVLIAAHLQRLLFWLSFAMLGLNLLLNAALIPPFSYLGAAAATSITEVALAAAVLVALARRLDTRWSWSDAARASRASVVLVVVLAAGYLVHPFIQVAAGVLVYVVVLLPTGALRWSDLGGLVRSGGPTAVYDPDGRYEVPDGDAVRDLTVGAGPVATFRDLQGSGAVEALPPGLGRVPVWLPVVARLAGCSPVHVEGAPPRDLVRRVLWPWFVDPAPDRPTVQP